MSTSLTSTLESTQQQLRKSSRGSSSKSRGSVSRRSAGSAVSRRSGSTHGGSGSGKYSKSSSLDFSWCRVHPGHFEALWALTYWCISPHNYSDSEEG